MADKIPELPLGRNRFRPKQSVGETVSWKDITKVLDPAIGFRYKVYISELNKWSTLFGPIKNETPVIKKIHNQVEHASIGHDQIIGGAWKAGGNDYFYTMGLVPYTFSFLCYEDYKHEIRTWCRQWKNMMLDDFGNFGVINDYTRDTVIFSIFDHSGNVGLTVTYENVVLLSVNTFSLVSAVSERLAVDISCQAQRMKIEASNHT